MNGSKTRDYGLPLPPADARGNRPARETLAVLLARDMIRHRKRYPQQVWK
jgi:hypothetical protein